MSALSLGIVLLVVAIVIWIIAYVIVKNSFTKAFETRNIGSFTRSFPAIILGILAQLCFWGGLISLVVALLQYLQVI